MKKNISTTDKLVRVAIAAIIGVLYYLDYITGTIAYVLIGAAIILLITSLINFCPLYKALGISSNKTN